VLSSPTATPGRRTLYTLSFDGKNTSAHDLSSAAADRNVACSGSAAEITGGPPAAPSRFTAC
jgi:hypothetical protein